MLSKIAYHEYFCTQYIINNLLISYMPIRRYKTQHGQRTQVHCL